MTERPDTAHREQEEASVELVPEGQAFPESAVMLQGEAAGPLIDVLGATVAEGAALTRRSKAVYRIVPRNELVEGLKDGSLRMATAHKGGDASVLVKETATGRIAGHADLEKARPGALKVLGPAAWQAMAMATQQHYLVEISSKLSGIQGGVSELLARLDDEKRAELLELRAVADRVRRDLNRGVDVGADDLGHYLYRAGVLQKELALAAERAANGYLVGERTVQEADDAFALAVFAAQTLAELSALVVGLPAGSAQQLQHRLDEEAMRLEPVRESLRAIAATLDRAHHRWHMHHAIYQRKRPKARALHEVNKLSPKKIGGPEPKGMPLSAAGVERVLALLGVADPTPESLLVEISEGDSVRVAVERTRVAESTVEGLTEQDIERGVTQYSDGSWWALGEFGPYKSREAAIERLRRLGAAGS